MHSLIFFTNDVDSLFEHEVGKVGGELGVAQHDGGDGVVLPGDNEARRRHLRSEPESGDN